MWWARHQIVSFAYVGLALNCAACTWPIPLDATLDEAPLVATLPLTIGVQYADDLPTLEVAVPEEHPNAGPGTELEFQLGAATVALFDQICRTMFEKTTLVEQPPEHGSVESDVDAILQVRFIGFSWRYPHTSLGESLLLVPGTYAAKIEYEIKFLSAQQDPIAVWRVSGESKNEAPYVAPAIFWIRSKVVELAMQDAVAHFLAQFEDDPKVADWLRSKNLGPKPNEIEPL